MTRTKKREATGELAQAKATGYTGHRFSSPKIVRALRTERGHEYMTAAEYREHRLHRGASGQPASAIREANAATKIRAGRKVTRR